MSRGVTGRRDINKAGGEEAEFPILCETCLGPNPYVRMTKQPLGAECKICTRPFTVFRWQPGSVARFKKTEVCQTCSKSRNVCQTCLLDLQFGLPTQVRDTALGVTQKAPSSAINREYYAQNVESAIEDGIDNTTSGGASGGAVNFGRADPAAKEMLKKLARQHPSYNKNRPHLCSFFAKGECTRGDTCPYRHELPKEDHHGLAKQNIQDRYHGTNDPVARRMLNTVASSQGLADPEDTTIVSLYLTSIPSSHNTDSALRSYLAPLLSSGPKGIRSIVPVTTTNCAFVNFAKRQDAEEAAHKLSMRNIGQDGKGVKVSLGEEEVGVQWGRPRRKKIVEKMAEREVESKSEATVTV